MELTRPHLHVTTPRFTVRNVLVAALVAGLAGTAVKTVCELISAPRAPGVPSPLLTMIQWASNALTGHGVAEHLAPTYEKITHWIFGATVGAGYCLVAEKRPIVRLGYGAAFGVGFWLVLHEIFLPLVGFSPSPVQMTLWEQGNELVSHALYGMGVELTRRLLRRHSDASLLA